MFEAGKTHARASAPDHGYYAQVKDRKDGKRAALSEARKILRQACHILAELGDDALTAAWARHPVPMVAILMAGQVASRSRTHPMGHHVSGKRRRAAQCGRNRERHGPGSGRCAGGPPAAAGGEGMTGAISVPVSAVGRPSGGPSACSAML